MQYPSRSNGFAQAERLGWQPGPLPPDTWLWGAVVGRNTPVGLFQFADFRGDHVITAHGERIEARDVLWWTNPINELSRD